MASGEAVGKPPSCSWTAIKEAAGENALFSLEYLPEGVKLNDPSKIHASDCVKLLQFWKEREDRGEVPFQFSHIVVGRQKVRVPAKYPIISKEASNAHPCDKEEATAATIMPPNVEMNKEIGVANQLVKRNKNEAKRRLTTERPGRAKKRSESESAVSSSDGIEDEIRQNWDDLDNDSSESSERASDKGEMGQRSNEEDSKRKEAEEALTKPPVSTMPTIEGGAEGGEKRRPDGPPSFVSPTPIVLRYPDRLFRMQVLL